MVAAFTQCAPLRIHQRPSSKLITRHPVPHRRRVCTVRASVSVDSVIGDNGRMVDESGWKNEGISGDEEAPDVSYLLEEWGHVVAVLSDEEAASLYALRETDVESDVHVDLGTRVIRALINDVGVVVDGVTVTWDSLSHAKRSTSAWILGRDGMLLRIALHGEHMAVSLRPVPDAAPTITLGGFGMHRYSGSDPIRDTETKVKAAKPRGAVLDICTGLGYTAGRCANVKDVEYVYTIERDAAVAAVARVNPWSKHVYDAKVVRVLGDAVEVVNEIPDKTFDTIIHDPPALALAGELYGQKFYDALHRVSRDGANMFHYIGNPGSKESGRLYKGVMKRLQIAGFMDVGRADAAFGVVARRDQLWRKHLGRRRG